MKILILGLDGYIGWPLANHLKKRGHEVSGVDNLIRRFRVSHEGSESLIPIDGILKRQESFPVIQEKLQDLRFIEKADCIVHLAEQPSAPWSMRSQDTAFKTQRDNVLGTLTLLWLMKKYPDAHLVKLGTMGEYGTPDCDIPEGYIEDGPMKGLMFPRQAGSFYHLSKVFDSYNLDFAYRNWGIRSTDIMQGVVFGHIDGTRFDYDECFGTVINRFCVQAVAGVPLTVYGAGGQTRGYLPLKDSIKCLTLAVENPSNNCRVFNQYAELYSVNFIAQTVQSVGQSIGLNVDIQHIENPRKEKESHSYYTKNDNLVNLGYKPDWDFRDEIAEIIEKIIPYRDQIRKEVIMPRIKW